MKKAPMVILASASLLTGCASSLDALWSRPVIEDDLEGVVSTASLSAERRTVVVKLLPTNGEQGKFCAEPPPDVAQNITTSMESSLEAKLAELPADAKSVIKDTLKKEAVILSTRAALLDVYRTGTYSLCQYNLNGAMNNDALIQNFQLLTNGVINGLTDAARQASSSLQKR